MMDLKNNDQTETDNLNIIKRCNISFPISGKPLLFDNLIPDKLLTIGEVASMLNCAIKTIRNWVYKGEIPYRKVGRKMVRFSRVEIENWLADRRN